MLLVVILNFNWVNDAVIVKFFYYHFCFSFVVKIIQNYWYAMHTHTHTKTLRESEIERERERERHTHTPNS